MTEDNETYTQLQAILEPRSLSPLEHEVYTEADLLTALGVERPILDRLRLAESFPYVRLGVRNRVYLTGQVLEWLRSRSTWNNIPNALRQTGKLR